MGVLSHSLYGKTKALENQNPPFPSLRMAKLFYEFLSRYKEWKIAKLKELISLHIVLILGLCAFILPWVIPNTGIIASLAVFIPFCCMTSYYLKVNKLVCHLYVNVHILHHHLIGKLEVGFCEHNELCHCAENFRYYVLKHYGISLDNRTLD